MAMENPVNKWRFLAGKIIYKSAIFHGYVSHNQRVIYIKVYTSATWNKAISWLELLRILTIPARSSCQLWMVGIQRRKGQLTGAKRREFLGMIQNNYQ